MTEERIDDLIRRLDRPVGPDPTFVETTYDSLLPRLRRARDRDAQLAGRWRAILSPSRPMFGGGASSASRHATVLVLGLLLVAALLVSLVMVGALRRDGLGGNGPLMVSHGGDLLSIDPETSVVRSVLHDDTPIVGLSRSPNGRLVSFWTGSGTGTRLQVANADGSGRHPLASELAAARGDCPDDWAPDSGTVASEVLDAGVSRILLVDVRTGNGSFVTPPGVVARCPLWSPDGDTIAFERDGPDGHATVAVIGRDGTGMRDVSGDLGGMTDYGTNGWSPDGSLIYFGAGNAATTAIFRASIRTGTSERLTGGDIHAFAPMVSPDGSRVSFMVWGGRWWDLHVMRSDGTDEHRVLEHATNSGWSTDGRYILAQWHQPSAGAPNGGLTLVTPDGVERRVVLPFDWVCPANPANGQPRCVDGVGWGLPTP